MVDEARVLRLLRSLTDDVSRLETESTADNDRRADPMWLAGIKYFFITAIEAAVDVAHHICAAEGWGPPQTNGDAMTILGSRGVLEGELAERMRRAVGFRNVLVHEYVEVDDTVVLDQLKQLADLRDFARSVIDWTARSASSG